MTADIPSGDAWQAHAACADDAEKFFSKGPAQAKAVCGGCAVKPECLYDALDADAPNGIWGGLNRAERRQLPALPASRGAALVVLRELLTGALEEPPPADAASEPAPAAPVAVVEPAMPLPKPKRGGRYTPVERAAYERRTRELLLAGKSFSEIREQVGISAPTITRIRDEAGIKPSRKTGGHPARTVADVLALHVEPYGEGHARWTGPMTGRMPQLQAGGTRGNARRAVFEQHHGRPPVGRIRSNCGVTECIAGAHLTDNTLRAAQQMEAPVTVQALKNLLDEIDEQGGPQAARDNRLRLTDPTPEEPDTMPDTTSHPSHIAQAAANGLPFPSLLEWADKHADSSVQEQAARARADVQGLRARYAADQELTLIGDEAAQLEKRLAELRAREAELAPTKKTKRKTGTYVRDYDPRTVRAWAADNGIECPRVGQIPKRVLEAWRASHAASGGEA